MHGLGNPVVLGLFGASWWLRRERPHAMETLVRPLARRRDAGRGTGCLGGELVDRLGVGVDPGANPDAPSSLSDQPAQPGQVNVDQPAEREEVAGTAGR